MNGPAVRAEGLVKSFGGKRVLDHVSFSAPAGTILGLLGPNGAGKTTAVRILCTLTRPDSGYAHVLGHDVVREAQQVRRLIGLAGQYAALDDQLSGRENLYMIARLLGLPRHAARRRAVELLEAFSLTDAAAKTVKAYSGGMRRRLDLAASLVGDPRVLFLDEPTTGLDVASRGQLWDLISRLAKDGATVLLTTQYLEEADQLADWIVVIAHGRVLAEDTPDNLKKRSGGQVIEVRPSRQADLDAVARILARVTGTRTMAGRDAVSAPAPDPDLLPRAARRLDEAAIPVSHLALRLPTMDEVFLKLTGSPQVPPPEITQPRLEEDT